jgi:peroxiredoxin
MTKGSEGTSYSAQAVSVRTSRSMMIATVAALIVSVTLNVLLARRVSVLANGGAFRTPDKMLRVGTVVPTIWAKRLGGQQQAISFQGSAQPTVLYIFTPPCSWCVRNIDNLKTLLDKEGGQYRFIGLSLSEQGLAAYIGQNNLTLPVYSGLSPETLKTYKLGSTPQTIVISPEGKVLQDWTGAYVGDQKSEVEAFFHVTLPGLRELPKAEAAQN